MTKLTKIAVIGLLLAIAAAIFMGWMTEEVLEGDAARFDAYARAAVHSETSSSSTSVMWAFTDLASAPEMSGLFVTVSAVLWARRWRHAVVMLAITMAGAGVLVEVLKLGFHRLRPEPYFHMAPPASFSYPSGHSLFSFAFFGAVASLTTSRVARRWVRITIWAAAAAIIVLVGLSRIYLGFHYPTDVIAGYLTAFIWVIAVSWGDRVWRRHWRREHPDTPRET